MDDKKLRKLALAATEGPWTTSFDHEGTQCYQIDAGAYHGIAEYLGEEDAAYIAAVDPQSTIERLDRQEVAERLIDTLAETVDGFQTGFNRAEATIKAIGEFFPVCGEVQCMQRYEEIQSLLGKN